jgi:putative FmdB family regulatory protein
MPQYDYECPKGHEYTEVLSVDDYQKSTKCPKCKKVGKKVIKLSQIEPTFSDKMFPYYDRSLNKVFENKADRSSYLKSKGLGDGNNGSMTRKQERQLYDWRMGRFDPRIARHALRD